jgi:hypothetical protein
VLTWIVRFLLNTSVNIATPRSVKAYLKLTRPARPPDPKL